MKQVDDVFALVHHIFHITSVSCSSFLPHLATDLNIIALFALAVGTADGRADVTACKTADENAEGDVNEQDVNEKQAGTR